MSKVQMLRSLVNQRLTAAAEEIFELFERTIAEYEEQLSRSIEEKNRQQKLLDVVLNPEVLLYRSDVQQLVLRKAEVLPKQQKRSSSLNQEELQEPTHIKEEQEEFWISQRRAEEEADINGFTFNHVPLKSEEEDGEKPQSSQLHENQSEENRDTEHLKIETDKVGCGGSEADREFNPDRHLRTVTPDKTSHLYECYIDDIGDWEERDEPQEGLNPLKYKDVAVNDMKWNTGNTSVSSSECAPSFGQNKQMQEYDEIQTGEKPFSCSICGKRYPSKKHLNLHIRRHSAEKPFSCSFCKKSFLWRKEMVAHVRIHTGERPFSCSVCGKSFTGSGNLSKHSVVHTGKKQFSCSICGKTFAHHGNLKKHSIVHTGEKLFNCSVCGKRFAQSGDLKRHFLIHTGEKPFGCSICDRRFTRQSHVKQHKCSGVSSGNLK
ncbi:gastrula zinc finger protein XlCGF57.1-like [Cheilinus undulatus]|uniref:gastrula zinc finger protein XlCGF57.1-like n=1 Tax=Cheilinus undulatus TaxID=241271 RepID=UPI001BD23104|nr:gastrula zinc finger protein XlCGF57.1-like [Cheilinus undulatus]